MKKIEKVCIIDDDSIFIYGAKRLMKETNFCENLTVFNNGQDALESFHDILKAGEELPFILFLDINMPIMTGWEFLDSFIEIVGRTNATVSVYIMSSSVDPRDLDQVLNYPIVKGYILKPLTPKDLQKIQNKAA